MFHFIKLMSDLWSGEYSSVKAAEVLIIALHHCYLMHPRMHLRMHPLMHPRMHPLMHPLMQSVHMAIVR